CEKILLAAREQQVDIIGLSGLITPSLDEMAHVAKEMEREGFKVPLLIGGATTSKAHTAVKIAPGYSQPVIHVLDASRAVPVVGSLIRLEQKPAFVRAIAEEYDRLRTQHAGQAAKLIGIEEARRRALKFDWAKSDIPQPEFLGVRALSTSVRPELKPPLTLGAADLKPAADARRQPQVIRIDLADLVPFIDWSP